MNSKTTTTAAHHSQTTTMVTTTTTPTKDDDDEEASSSAVIGEPSSCDNEHNDHHQELSSMLLILRRHFSTIGIGDVFVNPPPHPFLKEYLTTTKTKTTTTTKTTIEATVNNNEPNNNNDDDDDTTDTVVNMDTQNLPSPFISWEIVGTIKSIPEDFIVREIFSKDKIIPCLVTNDDDDDDSKKKKGKKTKTLLSRLACIASTDDDNKDQRNEKPLQLIKLRQDFTFSTSSSSSTTQQRSQEQSSSSKTDNEVSSLSSKLLVTTEESSSQYHRTNNNEAAIKTPTSIHENEQIEDKEEINDLSPSESINKIIKYILSSDLQNNNNNNNNKEEAASSVIESSEATTSNIVIESLDELYKTALKRIVNLGGEMDDTNKKKDDEKLNKDIIMTEEASNPMVWIPPIPLSKDSRYYRGILHRSIQIEYPLLKSESVEKRHNDSKIIRSAGSADKDRWFCVTIDTSFDCLIPFLYNPGEDLKSLYLFRNQGSDQIMSNLNTAPKTTFSGDKVKKVPHRDGRANNNNKNNGNQVILRLHPGTSKDNRRVVHHLISKKCRNLKTSTISDYPLNKQSQSTSSVVDSTIQKEDQPSNLAATTCSAVVVQWSRNNKSRGSIKKRKRNSQTPDLERSAATTSSVDLYPNILCVLKKRQKEHLTAIQNLAVALRCRPSDIGLAGIKDMQAVTYQYCTLRHTQPSRVVNANRILRGKGMELDINNMFKVDWVLNNGELDGNYFEIFIRNMSRVKVVTEFVDSGDSKQAKEVLVPCEKAHIRNMVERIRSSGFINFYGEQRLGAPGSSEEVGVRASDIGRAMLQQNFALAVDLLLTGRTSLSHTEGGENENFRRVREMWKATGGDVVATLKCLPKGNAFPRERAVLKGLKRYGKNKPLEALRCLQYSLRIFWINAYQSFIWNTAVTERIKRYGLKVVEGDLYQGQSEATEVKVVDHSSLPNVTLAQIVLPLPGYNVEYPRHEIGTVYNRLLQRDGVKFEKHAPDESTAKGSYRRILAAPTNMSVKFGEATTDEDCDAIVKAMTLSFELPKGCYATMLLRELMLTTATRPKV